MVALTSSVVVSAAPLIESVKELNSSIVTPALISSSSSSSSSSSCSSSSAACTSMVGNDFYNANSGPQEQAAAGALLLVPQAIADIPIQAIVKSNTPFLSVVDYGASEGKNSAVAMSVIIQLLQSRADNKQIGVFYNDLPGNDWVTLFKHVNGKVGNSKVFGFASGTSFYNQCMPDSSVLFGWSNTAVHWLSREPLKLKNHWWATPLHRDLYAAGELEAFHRQSCEDWRLFLSHRAKELVPGGRLVVSSASMDENGPTISGVILNMRAAMLSLVEDGTMTAEDFEQMQMPFYVYRNKADYCAPLSELGLEMDEYMTERAPCVFMEELSSCQWEVFTDKYCNFVEAFAGAVLKSQITGDECRRTRLCSALFSRLREQVRTAVEADPSQFHIEIVSAHMLISKPLSQSIRHRHRAEITPFADFSG